MQSRLETMKSTAKNTLIGPRLSKGPTVLTTLKTLCLLGCVLGVADTIQAQGISASAQISSQPAGGGLYDYTITLNNSASSTSPIETFWFAWLPNGDNFLPSSPASTQAPAGWGASVITSYYYNYYYYYDYSIEFTSSSAPLNPGQSLSFGFVSSDSPAIVEGNSSIYPGYQVDTSYLYNGVGAGNGAVVLPQVPEPAALSLLLAASLGYLLLRENRRQCQRPIPAPAHCHRPLLVGNLRTR